MSGAPGLDVIGVVGIIGERRGGYHARVCTAGLWMMRSTKGEVK